MIDDDNGHIVTIASLAGLVGVNKLVDYSASKFAVVGFDESLRLELEVIIFQPYLKLILFACHIFLWGSLKNILYFIRTKIYHNISLFYF
jgi:hypothetical protein